MPRRAWLLILVLGCFIAGSASAAHAAGLHFTGPLALPGSLPSSDPNNPQRQGGEPSAVFDPGGQLVYAASPGAPDHGGNFWRSTNGGQTFGPGISVGGAGPAGGGDSDLAVGFDAPHTVFYADLEDLAASDICRSSDHGQSFPGDGCSSGSATNQQDAAADRPWLTTEPGKPGLVYLTYDGLAFGGGAPEVQQSTDNGQTFSSCGQVLQPGTDAFAHFSPTGALENSETIGKSAVGPDGSIYVPFTEPHHQGQQVTDPTNPLGSNLYVGIGRGGCPSSTSTFKDVSVFQNDQGAGSEFVDLFPSVAVDPGGTVYMLGDGHLSGDQKGDGVYLFVSTDKGEHWSKPIQVDAGPPHAAQLAALAAGNGPGEVIVGWYESDVNPDHNSTDGRWQYHVAETFDSGRTFDAYTVTPTTFHYGDICDFGTLCTTGNRNLLDFTTVAVNPATGCGFTVFAGDPFDTPSNQNPSPSAAYTAVQDGGPCLTAANAGTTGPIVAVQGPASHPAPIRTRKKCVDRRKFKFRLHHARRARVVAVDVYVNGKRKVHRRGRNIRTVTLRRLPRKKFVVNVVSRQSTGSTLISTRTYKGCKKSRPHTRRRRHRR